MYVYRLYYRATAWNMAMGNVILFRADRLAITIIKKAFIIILSNPRRRQTAVDPIPVSPSLESPVLNSIPVREWPNSTPAPTHLSLLEVDSHRQPSAALTICDWGRPKNRSHKYAHKATFSIFHFLFDVRRSALRERVARRRQKGTERRRTLHAIAIAIEFELCQRSNKLLRALN